MDKGQLEEYNTFLLTKVQSFMAKEGKNSISSFELERIMEEFESKNDTTKQRSPTKRWRI